MKGLRPVMVCVAVALLLAGSVASRAVADRAAVLLAVDEAGKVEKANLAAWGAGKAEVDEKTKYLNRDSLRVETLGLYEGGRLTLQLPLDLTDYLTSPSNACLDMWVKIVEPKVTATPGMMGMPGMEGMPMMPGGMPMTPGMEGPLTPLTPGMEMMPGGMQMMPGGMQGAPMMPGGMPMMPGGMQGAPMMPGGMPMMPGGMPMMPGGMPMMPGGMQGAPMMPGGMQGMPMTPGMQMPPGMPMMPGMNLQIPMVTGEDAEGFPTVGQATIPIPGMGGMMMPGDPAMLGMPGGMPGAMPGMEGMMMPGMAPTGMAPGGLQDVKEPARKIRNLRALLVTDKGPIDSGLIEVGDFLALDPEFSDNEGWVRLVVSLGDFKPARDRAGAALQHVALFGDAKGEFYVGSLRLVQEDQPLKADAGPDRVVKKGQEVTFSAASQSGATKSRYSWDFDDLVQGIGEDAQGQRVDYTFDEEGFYKVTLTVTDPEGKRVPRVDRVNVTVQ